MSHSRNPQNTPQQPQSPQPQHQWSPQHQPPHSNHQQPAHNFDPQQWAPAQNAPAYGAGGYPQQPYGQKPPKRKKPLLKRWWFWLLVVIVIIAVASAIGGGGDDTNTAEGGSSDAQQSGESTKKKEAADKPAEEASYGIGDTVAADDWEITVAEVEDGVSQVGDEFLNAKAQGQFVQIELSVKNTGSDPNFFFEDDIKLGDESGNTYSADSEAGIYAAENNILFLEEINPGNTAEGVLVFDVPEDADPNKLTFAGGLFSDPVEISLK
ncbi:DUF4352 domain-containing protein [Brevibacterium sediminis]|uniref:DUF4352 domain-containing protein n=1 Tax=Brevibacterium sediminis TaxID=1857024 RepID=A0A5C4X142_9MICO|nr:DUF4352 domain-containing protein [Brevibacterium sediminis]TNM53294.1 DUF4352 domain-containing protein [Brevibacterium sediminis]